MGEAQAHGHRRWSLQRDDQAEQAPAVVVDGHGQIGASDGLAVALIDHDEIDRGVVDLHPLQRGGRLGGCTGGRLQRASRIGAFALSGNLAGVQGGNPRLDGVAGRDLQALGPARLGNVPIQRGQGALGAGEEASLDALADQSLDRLRQTSLTFAAVGLAGGNIRRHADSLPVPPNQEVDPATGQAELGGSLVGLGPPNNG